MKGNSRYLLPLLHMNQLPPIEPPVSKVLIDCDDEVQVGSSEGGKSERDVVVQEAGGD